MLPAEGSLTSDDGVRLWFQTVGSGPQVVVLPNGFHLVHDFAPLAEGRTLLFYDVRNRGRSETVTDPAKLARGIHNDVDDLEAVRRHLGLDRLTLIGHSYMGLMVILYAIKHLARVDRIVQIGAMGPDPRKQYPPELTANDDVLRDTMARLSALPRGGASCDPAAFCREFWSILRVIYVTDPKDADRIRWGRCDLPNEQDFMRYFGGYVMPSIQALTLTRQALAAVTAPVLTIHGTKDRSAPYGGGKDWAEALPHARLLTVENAGHAPWIEEANRVFGGIDEFLNGR